MGKMALYIQKHPKLSIATPIIVFLIGIVLSFVATTIVSWMLFWNEFSNFPSGFILFLYPIFWLVIFAVPMLLVFIITLCVSHLFYKGYCDIINHTQQMNNIKILQAKDTMFGMRIFSIVCTIFSFLFLVICFLIGFFLL